MADEEPLVVGCNKDFYFLTYLSYFLALVCMGINRTCYLTRRTNEFVPSACHFF